MEAVSYPIRIPKNVIELANLRTKEEHVDKSTAIRQFLYMGARDYVFRDVSERQNIFKQSSRKLEHLLTINKSSRCCIDS